MIKTLKLILKILSLVIIVSFIVFLFSRGHIYKKSELEYGVTFSKQQAQDLGLDWQETFLAILSDLGVKKIRLSAYWNEIEPQQGVFNWTDLDWLINEASKHNVEIILAIGGRLPRWPECHFPKWTDNLTKKEKEDELLAYITQVIERYKDNSNIVAWQIENEPFLTHFGDCPKLDTDLLDKEISLAKSLDNRPIIVTDSGELSVWIPASKRADIFGTTMYLHTYSSHLKNYINYPISPGFFRFKKNVADLFSEPKEWIVIELQAEPWAPAPFQYVSQEERNKTMNLEKFKNIIDFSSKTGFNKFYLWGVEWWFWELKNGNPEIWNYAKTLFKQNYGQN